MALISRARVVVSATSTCTTSPTRKVEVVALRLVATSFMVTGQSAVGALMPVAQLVGLDVAVPVERARHVHVLRAGVGVGATGVAVIVGWVGGFSARVGEVPMASMATRPTITDPGACQNRCTRASMSITCNPGSLNRDLPLPETMPRNMFSIRGRLERSLPSLPRPGRDGGRSVGLACHADQCRTRRLSWVPNASFLMNVNLSGTGTSPDAGPCHPPTTRERGPVVQGSGPHPSPLRRERGGGRC